MRTSSDSRVAAGFGWEGLLVLAVLAAAVAAVSAIVQPVLSAMLNDAISSRQGATIISLQSLVVTFGLGIVQLTLFAIGAHKHGSGTRFRRTVDGGTGSASAGLAGPVAR